MLGKELKSDEILDLLETYEIEVIYDFDRTHENIPDKFWATAQELGMQLRFDEHQVLRTIFLSVTEEDGFAPADLRQSDIRLFQRKQDVRDFAAANGISASEGETDFFGSKHDWIKLDYSGHSVHYDFGGGPLKKVTLNSLDTE